MKKNVLITDYIAEDGLNLLKKQKDFTIDIKTNITQKVLCKIVGKYHALVIRSHTKVDKNILKAAKNLEVIACASVGTENVDIEYATKKGVLVINTPDANTTSTAEHTFALLLCITRKLCSADTNLKSGKWERETFMGNELKEKILGIIGLGHVGTKLAHMASGFDMNIIGYDPYTSDSVFNKYDVKRVDFEKLIKNADIISVHVPKNKATTNLISKKEIKKMKDGVVILNTARGGIVNEKDLYRAIKNGKIRGAGIDTWECETKSKNPLLSLQNVISTPHIGANTEEAQIKVSLEVSGQLIKALHQEVVDYPVNLPGGMKDISEKIKVYANLSEKLGSLVIQSITTNPDRIEIWYRGTLGDENTSILKLAFLQGVLKHTTDRYVSYVNVLKIAEKKNLKIKEVKDPKFKTYESAIKVVIYYKNNLLTVGGTVYSDKYPRITRVNHYYFEVIPEGDLLLIRNYDKPGAIGIIGTVLGKHKINIDRFNLASNTKREKAMAIVKIDKSIDTKIKKELMKSPYIIDVKEVKL